ncbi:peptidoglycan-binding protein (plasmid) [Kovacikia minuta CCNUW1]|uniref:peptidoglycan-binding domain-containing protein n=1 Tax=Kovacikia minuta TaxID=2931930 RepID=UPI001CCAA6B0|nr:peptidoglycan-binding domain-containing protein [Kovacikia minuta]UBF29823.1 peptidoglycan-binding protein [Kovacikia minuta CCNUW1]
MADVQQYLKQVGLYTGAIDGIYGEESQAAIVQFQELADLRMDGIVGAETWRAMINNDAS